MNFAAAAQLSATGLHIRRESWAADRWLIRWLGGWHLYTPEVQHLVEFADYTEEDLLAEDWTTMPAPLAACPVDPAIGSTGGAVAPPPGAPAGVPASEDGGGGPPFRSGGGFPEGPGKKTTYRPKPRQDTGCSFGELNLSATASTPADCEVQLDATGLSPGNYSVVFRTGTQQASGGVQSGPDFTATASFDGLDDWIGKTLYISATVTGFGTDPSAPCRGQQSMAETSIDPFLPPTPTPTPPPTPPPTPTPTPPPPTPTPTPTPPPTPTPSPTPPPTPTPTPPPPTPTPTPTPTPPPTPTPSPTPPPTPTPTPPPPTPTPTPTPCPPPPTPTPTPTPP